MKKRSVVASAFVVFLGFSAGVGSHFLPMTAVVRGAPGDPNPALKSVAHDPTLAGDGTAATPLGIANRGVTAPKLSAAAPPAAGQLLGFNGANLAWQNAPVGGVRVVDSLDRLVGPTIYGENWVLLRASGFTFQVSVGPTGFETPYTTLQFLHTTSDCSGAQYLGVGSGLRRSSENNTTELFYAAEPIEQVTIRSYEFTDINNPGLRISCSPLEPYSFTTLAGPATSLHLSSLGLVPPFHLEF